MRRVPSRFLFLFLVAVLAPAVSWSGLAHAQTCPSSRYPRAVLTDGPLGYWRFSELAGPTAVDRSGNGHEGTYSGANLEYGIQVGCDDTAVRFTDGRITVPHAVSLNPAHITLEAVLVWHGPNMDPSALQRILEKSVNADGTLAQYGLMVTQQGHVQFELSTTAGGPYFLTTDTVLIPGEVVHVAATYDGAERRIYVNGQLAKTGAATGTIRDDPHPLAIANQAARNRPLRGTLDEVSVYGTALAPARIEAHFDASPAAPTSIQPMVECVVPGEEGGRAVFSTQSSAAENIHAPVGELNHVDPDPEDRGQPTWIAPGTRRGVFSTAFGGDAEVSWSLGTRVATATSSSPACVKCAGGQGWRAPSQNSCFALDDDPEQTFANTLVSTDSSAGTMAGGFSVGPDGAAGYSIPLWVPPGRAGIQPDLSLRYSSNGGDGPLGVGFSLGGLSYVTRCPRTLAQDGAAGAIQFDESDRFCLGGQRLVLVDGGTYGQAGTEYRLEQDTIARIRIDEADAQGPLYFTVFSKDGRVLRYGLGGNSNMEGKRATWTAPTGNDDPPTATYADVRYGWALSEGADRSGNRMYIEYDTEPSWEAAGWPLEHLPRQILYTAFDNGPTTRSVRFIYEEAGQPRERPDLGSSYVSGFKFKRTRLLRRVQMWAPNPVTEALVKEYRLQYGTPSMSQRSVLMSVRECDPAGVCLTPTEFTWEPGSIHFDDIDTCISSEHVNWSPEEFSSLAVADIDGDGRDDILYRAPGLRWMYHLSTGEGFGSSGPNHCDQAPTATDTGIPAVHAYAQPVPVDLERDGKPELSLFTRLPSGSTFHRFYKRTGGVFRPLDPQEPPQPTSPELDRAPPSYNLWMMTPDLDGDGLADAVRPLSEGSQLWLGFRHNTGGVLGTYQEPNPRVQIEEDDPSALRKGRNFLVVDVDGDDRAEVLLRRESISEARFTAVSLPGSGSTMIRATTLPLSTNYTGFAKPRRYFMLDLNGDGLTDLVELSHYARGFGREWDPAIVMNTGNGFAASVRQPIPDYQDVRNVWDVDNTDDHDERGRVVDLGVRVMDYNQDGRQDLLLMDQVPGGAAGRDWVSGLVSTEAGLVDADPQLVQVQPIAVGAPAEGDRDCWDVPEGHACAPMGGDPPGYRVSQVLDANGDGQMDFVQVVGGRLHLYMRRATRPDVLKTITNGLGAQTTVTYKPISPPANGTEEPVYTPGAVGCAYPLVCETRGHWVVAQVSETSGQTGSPSTPRNVRYRYSDSRRDLTGRGWLGFASQTVIDEQTGAKTVTTYENTRFVEPRGPGLGRAYPFAWVPRQVTSTVSREDGALRTLRVTTDYETVVPDSGSPPPRLGRYFFHPTRVVRTEEEVRDASRPAARSSRVMLHYGDGFENVTRTQFFDSGGEVTTRNVVYRNTTSSWLMGLPERITTSSVVPRAPRVTRTTSRTYDPDTGLLRTETIEPDAVGPDREAYRLDVTYTRGPDGQVENVLATDGLGRTREVRFGYDPVQRIFPTTVTNTLGHVTRTDYHPGLGVLAAARDENGLTRRWRYDRLGRLREVLSPDGGKVSLSYGVGTGAGLGYPLEVLTVAAGGGQQITTFDLHRRPILQRATAAENTSPKLSLVSAKYDRLGRLASVSRPYFEGETPVETTYAYFQDGLLRTETHPGAGTVTSSYRLLGDLFQVRVTDARGHDSVQRVNGLGQVRLTQEIEPRTLRAIPTSYNYGAFGLLLGVTQPDGNQVTMGYDRLGRRTTLSDPDAGLTTFVFDGFGQVVREVGPNETTATPDTRGFFYDAVGRLDHEVNQDGTTQLVWDTAPNGLGRLAKATSPDGIVTRLEYDPLGRAMAQMTTVDGTEHRIEMTYDAVGRLDVLRYPTTPGWPQRLAVKHQYSPFTGKLLKVKDDPAGGGTREYWRVDERNAAGQLLTEVLGSTLTSTRSYDPTRGLLTGIETRQPGGDLVQMLGYAHDAKGNVTQRADRLAQVSESFDYDHMDRLTHWYRPSGPATSWDVWYTPDDAGNLTSRTFYGPDQTQVVSYNRTPSAPSGRHAVRSATVQVDGGTASTWATYGYDNRGNRTSGPQGAVTYTAFDLPKTITGTTATFAYDAFHNRVKKTTAGGETVYVGGLYEQRKVGGSVTGHVFYVIGPEGPMAQVNRPAGGSGETVIYLHADRLGSVDKFTLIQQTGGDLTTVAMPRHDPYGNEIDIAAPALPTGLDPEPQDPGVRLKFTGHEDDWETGLINMRGRVYDPKTATFLTADPVVPTPLFGQSFNRYAYALNNPINLVDPSGFDEAPVGNSCEGPPGDPVCKCLGSFASGPGCPNSYFNNKYVVEGIDTTDPVTETFAKHFEYPGGAVDAMLAAYEAWLDESHKAAGLGEYADTPEKWFAAKSAPNKLYQLGLLQLPPPSPKSSPPRFRWNIRTAGPATPANVQQLIDDAYKEVGPKGKELRLQAVAAAMTAYRIEVPRISLRVIIDPSLKSDAWLDREKQILSIHPWAFRSAGYLGSLLAHEIEVHLNRQLTWFDDKSTPEYYVQDIQAIRYVLDNAARFGLTSEEVRMLEGELFEQRNAARRLYYPFRR